MTAIPGRGSRVQFSEFTARIEYEVVKGRPMDMIFAVQGGKYAAKTLRVGNGREVDSTEIHDGLTATLVEKVFDRYVCDKLPTDSATSLSIDTLSPDWLLVNSDIECPPGSEVNTSSRCEEWRKTTYLVLGFVDFSLVLDKKTKYPLVFVQKALDTEQTMRFKTFTVGPPDQSLFEVPPNVTCTDFTRGGNSQSAPLLSSFNGSSLVNDPRAVAEVDEEARKMGWKAVPNKYFDGVTKDSAAAMLRNPLSPFIMIDKGTPIRSSTPAVRRKPTRMIRDIPKEYDARKEYPKCPTISQILDQASCGCCYAMAAASVLADRMCIASKGNFTKQLSTQWIIGCDDSTLGCSGGWVESVWHFLAKTGTPTLSCSFFVGVQTQCHETCDNGSPVTLYRSEEPVDLHGDTPEETVRIIQQEILEHGPVEAAFYVFSDFKYTDGTRVYRRTSSSTFQGGHAVRIIGWGEQDKIPYWLVANSWGISWAREGVFKISRGTNECGFENTVSAGVPILE